MATQLIPSIPSILSTPAAVKVILGVKGVNVNAVNAHGDTPLHKVRTRHHHPRARYDHVQRSGRTTQRLLTRGLELTPSL